MAVATQPLVAASFVNPQPLVGESTLQAPVKPVKWLVRPFRRGQVAGRENATVLLPRPPAQTHGRDMSGQEQEHPGRAVQVTAAHPAASIPRAKGQAQASKVACWGDACDESSQAPIAPDATNEASSDGGASSGGDGGLASVPLHKSAKRWLDRCVNQSSIASVLPSSEYWRGRRHYAFYRHLHCVLQRYASGARTGIDVGSSLPPFINSLTWLHQRAILGPAFAGNVGKGGRTILSAARIAEKFGVQVIQSDFLTWDPSHRSSDGERDAPTIARGDATGAATAGHQQSHVQATQAVSAAAAAVVPPDRAGESAALAFYDLVLCAEVVEHVERPQEFVRKLLTTGRLVVLSVPYLWESCHNTKCGHKQHRISRSQITSWAGRQPHAYDVVEEPTTGERRIICVYGEPLLDAPPRAAVAPPTKGRRA